METVEIHIILDQCHSFVETTARCHPPTTPEGKVYSEKLLERIEAAMAATAAQQQTEWIACSEKLPQEAGRYLGFSQWAGRAIEFFDSRCWTGEGLRVVTHWQPLPTPPKAVIEDVKE
jgi:hypothetical protein